MSSLYKDAIADARKLRETAEQNAKNRIIEAIAPKLRRMIERQINEGDDEFVDDSADLDGLLDIPEAMDMLDDEIEMELPMDEPMTMSPEPMDIDTDGFSSVEIMEDEEDSSEDESQNKSVHVNITVEGKRNHQLRRRAILLVKALSEAKSVSHRNKIRKQIVRLCSQLIITENSQNKRLANNLSVILKESNTMRKRKNSWLFEGKDGEAGEEMEMEDAEFDDEDLDIDAIKSAVADLASVVGMDMANEDMEADEDFDMDDEELEIDDDEEFEIDDEMGDETYESMREGDEGDEDDDEIVEVNEAMLRRALGASRRPARRTRATSRLSETRRQRRLAEAEAKAMASSFGGGKLGKEMFVDVDENTLLNALAEELGSYGNATAAQGKAAAKASHFGGGTIKKGGVMESRIRQANRKAVLAERKARAIKKELNESNLFNAKLLYVTKLMQQHTLNNKQQRAIVEAMDNAKTQREAKLLFKSLNESLNKRAGQKLTESKNAKRSLNESRTGYSNRSLQSGQAPRNSGVELDRWAILAGIRK